MFNLKNCRYFFSIPLVLSVLFGSQTLPTHAQNVSGGQAGFKSGTPPAYNNTVFGVPPTDILESISDNVTITNGQISVPNSVLTTVNNTAQVLISSNSQNEVIAIVSSSISPTTTSLLGTFDDPVLVEVITVVPNADGSNDTDRSSRQIRNIDELSAFVESTVGTILGVGTGEILIGGLTITVSPTFSQSVNDNTADVLTKTITLEKNGQTEGEFEIRGTTSQIDNVLTITTPLYYFNVDVASIRLASDLILAGADPTETANLMLSLNGVAMEGRNVDLNKLSSAINAYNAIIDKADADAIASLRSTEAFMDIGAFLKELRAAIG